MRSWASVPHSRARPKSQEKGRSASATAPRCDHHAGAEIILALTPGSYRVAVEREGKFYKTQVLLSAPGQGIRSSILVPMLCD